MVNYDKTSIYKIVCKDINIKDIYIGSTVNFNRRKSQHKLVCNDTNSTAYNYYVYKFIRLNGGFSNWDMIEIIPYPCSTKREKDTKEREYIELLGATLNKHLPTRTKQEYRDTFKEKLSNDMREPKECKLCGSVVSSRNMAQHKKSNKCFFNSKCLIED